MHADWPFPLRILLALHIACGFTGFVCAPVALAAAKGGRTHRAWGKVYFWAMAGVAVTALILSFALPIYFLAMVAVFSFYAAFYGYRILYLKDLFKGGKPSWIDWIAATLTILSSCLLLALGFLQPDRMAVGIIDLAGVRVSIVSVVFGLIGIRLGQSAIARFRKPPAEKTFWWFDHMTGMIASYIAAMTAFSAVNLSRRFENAWWVWLWPTIVGAPAIALWTRAYKRKFARKPGPAAL